MNLSRPNYLSSLIRLSSKVCQLVSFSSFCIGLPQLKRLVVACKHVGELRLFYCIISTPSIPNFSKTLINCQIQKLGLGGSGLPNCSDWKHNSDQFKNLIQGLSSSPDLRSNLKEINLIYCGLTYTKTEQILKESQLSAVKIIHRN
ncbi:unnamed protein product [Moneuplotes crassus]|uniref:Uncharacterized protein n=1 Tax=Euplotes crassus TaxID=5936 RepID=A0AAD2CW14_EUPCR|nr:unnamed protein product [Moneuplotes crassus]